MTQNQYFENSRFNEAIVPIPALIRAAVVLIALNALLVLWFYFSPGTPAANTPQPEAQVYVQASAKPSPFAPVVTESARKWVRKPPKAEPYFAEVVSPSNAN